MARAFQTAKFQIDHSHQNVNTDNGIPRWFLCSGDGKSIPNGKIPKEKHNRSYHCHDDFLFLWVWAHFLYLFVSFFHCDLSQLVNVIFHRRAQKRTRGHAPGKVPLAVEVLPDPRRFAPVAFLGKDARAKLHIDAVKQIAADGHGLFGKVYGVGQALLERAAHIALDARAVCRAGAHKQLGIVLHLHAPEGQHPLHP
nr:MAG TPA: hypothetical protein [Caudoviricetes sp.]